MWRFGTLGCLLMLSFARLAIHISPYSFHNWNHLLLSIICYLLFPAVVIMDILIRFFRQKSQCDFISDFILHALYNEKVGVDAPILMNVIYFVSLLTFAINLGIFLHKMLKSRNTVVPTSMLNNSQEPQDNQLDNLAERYIGKYFIP
jgi:hypothetical protein